MQSVPFFSNTKDNTHCFQASLKMILKYFYPNEDYAFIQLDKITNKLDGMWTWPMAGLAYLKNKGLEVVQIVNFDYAQFGIDGINYLRKVWPEEKVVAQLKHSDLVRESINASNYSKAGVNLFVRTPTIEDVKEYLSNNYLLICNVNGKKLQGLSGYNGHFVVVYDIDDKYIYIHNPGLPAKEGLRVAIQRFLLAWQDGLDLMAFRRNV